MTASIWPCRIIRRRAKVTAAGSKITMGASWVLDVGGNEKRYPAEQIVGVDSDWTPTELAADELFARREYTAALAKYEEAIRNEPRRWGAAQARRADDLVPAQHGSIRPRRRIVPGRCRATIRRCCISRRFRCAGCRRRATADLEKKSRDWLATDVPVAVLIGASHLLSTSDRNDAVKRLQVLAGAKDPRIAALARALVWSGTFAAASSKQLNHVER